MTERRIVLASGSPRRRELLAALCPAFDVIVSDVEEPMTGDPVRDAIALATDKALAVLAGLPDDEATVVIAADTIVHDGERAYAKPADAADAVAMLLRLRARPHTVVTGLAVCSGGRCLTAHSAASVTLVNLTADQIREYVASGRPLDKAGAYAIQDEDVPTVARLDGCYCAVMGLGLWRLRALLSELEMETATPDLTFERCRACPERGQGSRSGSRI